MNFNEWVKKYAGKKIDYDGVYGVQCVDLAKHYIDKVLGVKPESIGNAKEYWLKRDSKYIKSLFVPIKNTASFVARKGDVFVRTSGTCGHIGVCNGEGNDSYFYAYEQNYNGTHEGMTKHLHTDWSTINFLRPKKQTVSANGGLNAYTKVKTDYLYSTTIPNKEIVELVDLTNDYITVKGFKYKLCKIKYKKKTYYVAEKYLTV